VEVHRLKRANEVKVPELKLIQGAATLYASLTAGYVVLLSACRTQAAANAKNNNGAQKSKLYVAEAFADQGPILKRFRCRAQGR